VNWLCLLALPALCWASAPEVEAPDQRSYSEATPEMLARRAKSCREDIKDYVRRPSLDLMDRLAVCMEHPDGKLRAEVLDLLPDRRLWDRPDYKSRIEPVMREIHDRFQNDPNERVRLHASQLEMWLRNGRSWIEWASPAAEERRRLEAQAQRHGEVKDQSALKMGNYALLATVALLVLIGLFGAVDKRFLR